MKGVRTGVDRIGVTYCDTFAVGTGFLVEDDYLATAAHVVQGAAGITVAVDEQIVTATIVGMNVDEDVALLRADRPLTGHKFAFSDEDPPEATEVTALGYPQGEKFTSTTGRINALNVQHGPVFNGVGHIIQTNTVLNGGNSGGPLLTLEGNVAGIVRSTRVSSLAYGRGYKQSFDGTNYVSSGSFAKKLVGDWLEKPSPVELETCSAAALPTDNQIDVRVDTPDERAMQVAQSLLIHAQAINGGAYELAFQMFTPDAQSNTNGVANWSEGMGTSYWHSIDIAAITDAGPGIVSANVSMTTTQDPEWSFDGLQGCSIWHMRYTMVWVGVAWQIQLAQSTADPDPCRTGPAYT